MKFLSKYGIIFIFLLAFILRFINFSWDTPPSLNWDEASLGYNAYSILQTGKDEWGRTFPLTFEAFGDYKLPGYIYTLVPFIAVFDLNESSIRLPSVLFGSLAVVFLYFSILVLSKNKTWAYLSAIFLAISPWHFFLSRIALEANLALSFFIIGFYFLVDGLKKHLYLIPASLIFGLSIFTYNSARIFVPLFLFGFIILFWKQIKLTKTSLLSGLIFGIFLAVGFYLAVFQDSSARYYWVRILDEGAINYLEQSRNISTYPEFITKLIYNRPAYFIYHFVENYFKHFSPQFLILSGGSNYQFSLPGTGLIYFLELPLLLYGFIKLLKQKIGWVFIIWLLVAPIPSALTREAPHALRSIFMLGALQVITAYGLIKILALFPKRHIALKISYSLATILILINAGFYFYKYFNDYPKEYSQAWQYGYKEAVAELRGQYDKYPKIFFTKYYGEPHIFYLLFSKYNPSLYQNNETLMRDSHTNWRWVDRLDKIYFINDWEMVEKMRSENNALVIASPGNVPENSQRIKTIYFLDGSVAFEIVKI